MQPQSQDPPLAVADREEAPVETIHPIARQGGGANNEQLESYCAGNH